MYAGASLKRRQEDPESPDDRGLPRYMYAGASLKPQGDDAVLVDGAALPRCMYAGASLKRVELCDADFIEPAFPGACTPGPH